MNFADGVWMQQAIALAQRAIGISQPNPRVGCIIVGDNGQLLAQGYTQAPGQAHAEAHAIAAAQAEGICLHGATAYVSLEPCAHTGRTPPCTHALIHAGISRVVIATVDPNPLVNGHGVAQLAAAGIVTECFDPQSSEALAAREINCGFLHRMRYGQPWRRLKVASSLDGFIALPSGESQWITSETSRDDGQQWRARACAILTGVGTILADNPRFNLRAQAAATPLNPAIRQPHLLILDGQLRTPINATVIQSAREMDRQVHIFCAPDAAQEKIRALGNIAGVKIHPVPSEQGRIHFSAIWEFCTHQLPCNELHIEAGATLSQSLLANHAVDEILLYQAPILLGAGRGFAPPQVQLADAPRWRIHTQQRIGPDTRTILRQQKSAA